MKQKISLQIEIFCKKNICKYFVRKSICKRSYDSIKSAICDFSLYESRENFNDANKKQRRGGEKVHVVTTT